ncbi:hypothetical protein [Zhongshania marina]|jgi:hypothetical protein|uniref:Uncharacterized protein n=1 Tax=Zhongshania marina TaxID=2304603 RepID=A0A2S4HH65_9GAMM|nr:hypothetical protein [Marortus luteolus]POP53041.1 hypothetical protein C0068_08080 [Marortus luteolus]
MIDLSDYRLAWQVYLSVGLVAAVIWCMLLRRLSVPVLKYWLMIAGIVFLFLPVRHPDMTDLWVPSAGAAVLTIFTDGLEAAVPMLLAMAIAQIAALAAGVLLPYVFTNSAGNSKKSTSNKVVSQRAEPDIGLD